MLLTEKKLNQIMLDWRISVPTRLKKELLDHYGNVAVDDEGHIREYTEQDISEQLRKKLLA